MSEGWQQQQQRQQGGEYDDDASRMFICEEEEESSGGGMGFPCSSSPSSAATVEVAENAASIASCTSSAPGAGGISSSELDAWIRDEPMDCMMLLPDIQQDGGTTHDSMPQVSQDDAKLHPPPGSDDVDVATKPGYSMFCRSSSSCSSTFPESDIQECMELSIPEDFLDDKQQALPPLTEERASQRSPFPDLKKIIVKKPIMDKAVERLGGGRKGAIRLWNIIQVWLRHQQASGEGQQSPVDGILENVGFLGGMQLPFVEEVLGDGNAQCEQSFQTTRGGNSVVDDGNPFGCQQALLSASGAHAQYPSFVDPSSPQLGGPFYTYAGLRTVVDRDGSCTGLGECVRGPMSPAATTRAARKSRMARQRRHTTRVGGPSSGSWSSLVPSPADAGARQAPREQQQQQQHVHQCLPSYTCRDGKGRGCDKSVKFLLQKELKPSDVGNLGRIVLPKKEAEVHLPYLTLREGITMAMEDMLTTHTWHFRYRFWPNNKSRMYLLEGTGEFVKSHCLKEGDVLQIYRDCKYGKHLIYGKKIVRPGARVQAAAKSDDDNVSGVSSVSDSSKDAEHSGTRTRTVSSSQAGNSAVEPPSDSKLDSDGLERFPSLELGDEFIEEIMGLVDAPEEPSSPESGKEDS